MIGLRGVVGLVAVLVCSVAWGGALPLPPLPPGMSPVGGGELAPGLPLAPLSHVKGGAFDLRFVNVGQLVDLLYDEAMHTPHVISSDVLSDQRVVSFQYSGKEGDLHGFVKVFLDSLGFQVESKDGVDFVSKRVVAEAEPVDDRKAFVYQPRFRSAAYLEELVEPFVGGLSKGRVQPVSGNALVGGAVSGVQSSSAGSPQAPLGASGAVVGAAGQEGSVGRPRGLSGASVAAADQLVFFAKPSEVVVLEKLLPQLDTPAGEVVVRGWVYEVSDTSSTNSAFSIAAHLLDGQVGISNGQTGVDPTALTFDAHYLSVAISALSADSRFKEVSDPNVRVLSGEQVSLNVGSQVPTLGSVSYQGPSGTPVQSVDYQDAGVIFQVQPTVMRDLVRVQLDEQISSFVPTSTGVNNSPTKNTRELTTTVNMKDGEVVVLGGLVQDADTAAVNDEGWLPSFLDGKSGSKARTEVLLVLEVQKV